MSPFRPLAALLIAATLQACMSVPQDSNTATSASTAAPSARTFLFSWGMFADPVFERDVVTFNRAFAQAYGTPEDAALFAFESRRLADPSVDVMRQEVSGMAQAAVDGRDIVVVMLTSHGSPDVLAVKTSANGPVSGVSADGVAEFLAPLNNDLQIIILQACFSGSLIDELRSPNRIIMTAAAADRSSFGCNPESDNTWFIRNLNRAMGMGGSWQQVFARTQALVAQDEANVGVPASNPQSFVGNNMRGIWTANAN